MRRAVERRLMKQSAGTRLADASNDATERGGKTMVFGLVVLVLAIIGLFAVLRAVL
jgi:hypothetical protein